MSLVLLFTLDLSDLGVLGLAEGLSLVSPLSLLAFVVGAEGVHLGIARSLFLEQLRLVLVAHLCNFRVRLLL